MRGILWCEEMQSTDHRLMHNIIKYSYQNHHNVHEIIMHIIIVRWKFVSYGVRMVVSMHWVKQRRNSAELQSRVHNTNKAIVFNTYQQFSVISKSVICSIPSKIRSVILYRQHWQLDTLSYYFLLWTSFFGDKFFFAAGLGLVLAQATIAGITAETF